MKINVKHWPLNIVQTRLAIGWINKGTHSLQQWVNVFPNVSYFFPSTICWAIEEPSCWPNVDPKRNTSLGQWLLPMWDRRSDL